MKKDGKDWKKVWKTDLGEFDEYGYVDKKHNFGIFVVVNPINRKYDVLISAMYNGKPGDSMWLKTFNNKYDAIAFVDRYIKNH